MKKLMNLGVISLLCFLLFFTERVRAADEEGENKSKREEKQNHEEIERKSAGKNMKKPDHHLGGQSKAKEMALESIWARFEWEPSLREVQNIAVKHAFLKRKTVKSWKRRVRSAAWLPDVRVKLDQNQGSELRLKGEPGTSSQWAEKEGDGLSYGVQLTWSFNRLVFDPDELKVNREAHRMVELREEIMHNVTRVFFERRRIQVMNHLRPPRSVRAAALRRLAKERLEGLLDSITGGWYGKELKKRRPRQNRPSPSGGGH